MNPPERDLINEVEEEYKHTVSSRVVTADWWGDVGEFD